MCVKRRELSIKSVSRVFVLFCFFCLGRERCVRVCVIVMIEKGYLLQERE